MTTDNHWRKLDELDTFEQKANLLTKSSNFQLAYEEIQPNC